MIHRDLDERYQNCDEILDDFKKLRRPDADEDEKTACPACSHMNSDGSATCGGCSASLQVTCPICGAAEEAGVRFCGECGCDMNVGREVAALADEGKALLEGSHFQAAIEKFQEAREKDPERSDVMALLREAENRRDMLHTERTAVSALLSSGDFDRADERLIAAQGRYPDDDHLQALRGDLDRARAASRSWAGISTVKTLIKAKRFSNAREAAERLMMSQGRTQELLDLLHEAETNLEQIGELTQHAREIASTGTRAEALAAWKAVIELHPDDASARAEVQKIEKALGAVDTLIDSANRLLEAGDPGQAVKQLAEGGDYAAADPRVEEAVNRARISLDELEVGAHEVRDEIAAGNLDSAETLRAGLAAKFAASAVIGELEEEIRLAGEAQKGQQLREDVARLVEEKDWGGVRDAAASFLSEGGEDAEIQAASEKATAELARIADLMTDAAAAEEGGKFEDAALAFQEAMEAAPADSAAKEGYERTSAALEKLSGLIADANAARDANEAARAMGLYRQALELCPGHEDATRESAALEEKLAGRNKDLAEVDSLLATGSADAMLAQTRTFAASYAGDPDGDELHAIAESLTVTRDAILARVERLLASGGQGAAAASLAEMALRISPGDERATTLLASARSAAGAGDGPAAV